MEENKMYVRKSFFMHQYEEEEQLLRDMRSKGWKFVKLHKGIPTKYEFDKCEPADYIYQLDYVKTSEDFPSYHQLFSDAGWNECYNWDGIGGKWYYFEKENTGEEERIFTDQQSRIDLAQKILLAYGGFFLILLLPMFNSFNLVIRQFSSNDVSLFTGIFIPIFILNVIVMIWWAYMIIALVRHVNKLKKDGK